MNPLGDSVRRSISWENSGTGDAGARGEGVRGEMKVTTRVKVCCVSDAEELRIAVGAGVDAVGLVSAMPSGPGQISDTLIALLARQTPPGVDSFLLTSRTDADEIVRQHRLTRTSVVQLCDRVHDLERLRELLPGTRLVQVIHVVGPRSVAEAADSAPHVDALLLDSGRPDLALPELGGTGRTHDWIVSEQICRSVGIPVFLAGGLTPENVAEAAAQVQPFGVDVCSGVRTGGRLDASRLRNFLRALGRL